MSDVRASALGGSYIRTHDASTRIQFRRGLTLTAMTLLMPGSAQLVSGNKRVGRIAIRVWGALFAVTAVVGLVALTSRRGLFEITTNPRLITLATWLLVAFAIAWVALLVDAWRLAGPRTMARNHRLWMTGLNSVLCFATAGTLLFAAHTVSAGGHALDAVFASGTTSEAHDGRYNVLLLGGDSGEDRSGVRPDSLTVASIDVETGKTVLIGLPRNLQDVPFPKGSAMQKAWPDGFNCDDCYLNAINTWANDHAADLAADYPGLKQPGIEVTKDAVQELTGLKINYYAMVNMRGFAKLINAVGGVTIDVHERTAMFGADDAWKQEYIEAGRQKLTGNEALWYSRSRVQNDDFSRMGRQKCVMSAMLQELSPQAVLTNAQDIAKASSEMVSTDIPRSDLAAFMDLAIKAKGQKMSSVSLVPPVIYTGNPDYDKVRRLISGAVDKSEGKVQPAVVRAKLAVPDLSATGAKDSRKANQTGDLQSAC